MTPAFMWCPQEVAEGCSLDTDHAHICVTTPGNRGIKPGCGKLSINLWFHDLDPEAIKRSVAAHGDWPNAQEMINNCFREDHATEIMDFIVRVASKLVVVNCEAGISRSPGIVLALRRKFGGDCEEPFKRACPNIHVASVLGRKLGVGPLSAPVHPVFEDFFTDGNT